MDSATQLVCLATLMSSDRTKQICLWMNIYIYIYIYICLNLRLTGFSFAHIFKSNYEDFVQYNYVFFILVNSFSLEIVLQLQYNKKII